MAPAPHASPITGLRRREETILRIPFEGDNWHTTWAADGQQYTLMCDGQGYNTRLWQLQGDPPDVRFGHLPGYPELVSDTAPSPEPRFSRYYGFGIIACDGDIYHFLSTPNHYFGEPGPRFCGAKLIYSRDLGQTWHNQDGGPVVWEPWDQRSRENMVFFNEPDGCFSLLSLLQMGRNYELNRDGYVYVYSPNGNTEGTMNQMVMFRVPRDQILNRAAYEYFVACRGGGSASWSPAIAERGVVHTFPSGWVNRNTHPYSWHPCVVYNPGLGLYMMVNWGMGTDGEDWFTKPSYLGAWTAPAPWGPWTQVYEEPVWTPGGDPGARCYQPQIMPKWIAPDGRSFWLVWTDFHVLDGRRPYYAFNAQQVELTSA
jgi:hypothetical protein